jgi:hypothetical protein
VERYDGGEVDGRVVEGDQPDTEDLEDVDVEDEVGFVKCCEILSAICPSRSGCYLPTDCTLMSMRGLMILYHRYMAAMSHRELLKLPVRQKGWVNEALGVKYSSTVSR